MIKIIGIEDKKRREEDRITERKKRIKMVEKTRSRRACVPVVVEVVSGEHESGKYAYIQEIGRKE